nr:PREDICTED: protein shisa-4 isoform X2 [Rhinolophus sinicus]
MPQAGRWGTGRSSPAPPGLATRFGLGTRIKASGVCEPDWAQQRGEAWASAPMQEPALSWDRHGPRAWGCEFAAGGVAGGRGHGAGTCQSGPPETSLPRSTPARAMPLAVIALLVLGAPVVLAGTSCLGYLDENGSWHPGFSCPAFTFCCGTCHRRYCCGDLNLLLSKWQQKHCQGLSPKALAGVASAVALFVAVVITSLCCCLCTGYHLHRRRQQLHSLFEGRDHARGPGAGAEPVCTCLPARSPSEGHVWARTVLYAALTR